MSVSGLRCGAGSEAGSGAPDADTVVVAVVAVEHEHAARDEPTDRRKQDQVAHGPTRESKEGRQRRALALSGGYGGAALKNPALLA